MTTPRTPYEAAVEAADIMRDVALAAAARLYAQRIEAADAELAEAVAAADSAHTDTCAQLAVDDAFAGTLEPEGEA